MLVVTKEKWLGWIDTESGIPSAISNYPFPFLLFWCRRENVTSFNYCCCADLLCVYLVSCGTKTSAQFSGWRGKAGRDLAEGGVQSVPLVVND